MIATKLLRKLQLAVWVIFFGLLFSCGGTNGSSAGSPQPNVNPTSTPNVAIGNITTIPINEQSSSTAVVVTNSLPVPIHYISYSLGSNNLTPAKFNPVNVSDCVNVIPGGTCNITINTPSQDGSFALTMLFADNTGKQYTANQVISYSSTVPINNGFQVSSTNLNIYKSADVSTTVAIPFVLTQDYTAIPTVTSALPQVFTVQNTTCSNGVKSGSLCTTFVTISNIGTSPVVQNSITISGNVASKVANNML